MRGFTVPHACPAEIDALATAVTPEGRWFVLSAGGTTARCWRPSVSRPDGSFLSASMTAPCAAGISIAGR
jgi:hypothetical protein